MKHPHAKDHWLFILLCILVFWAPIPLGSNRPWSSSLLHAGYGFIAVMLCLQLGQHKLSLTTSLRQSLSVLALFLAIPLWSTLQLIPLPPDGNPVSRDITATLKSLQTNLWLALVFAICLQLVNNLSRLRTLALVIIASGVFEACYGVLTILGGKDFDILGIRSPYWSSGSATGTFINRNHLAGHLEMCLAIGTGLLIANLGDNQKHHNWRERARAFLITMLGEKARQRLLLIAMVIALVMTRSRMGNTAFFASMGICAGIGFLIYRRRSQSMVLLFGSMILIDVFIISAWFGLDKLVNRIEQTAGSREGRLDVNPDAWIWFKEHWLTGSGSGSFTTVFPSFRSPDVVGFYDYAHNDYLQLLGEYGVIGASFFAAIALFALWTALQAQRERRTPLLQGMAFGSMMGIISLLIHSSTDFNLHIPANAALFTILCAISFSARHLEGQGSKKSATIVTRAKLSTHKAKAQQPQYNNKALHECSKQRQAQPSSISPGRCLMTIRKAAITALVLALAGFANAETPVYQRVDFSTEVAREIPNDQMNATLSIEMSDKDAGKLAQQLTLAINDAIKKSAAYPSVKLSSGTQNTWPVYGSSLTSSSKLESWRGRAEIRLESKDFKAAGELIGKLQEKLQINGISFVVSADNRRKVEDSLTAEAISAFKTRATAISTAWNAKSYKLVQMSLGSASGPMPYAPMMRTMKAAEADGAPAQDLAGGDTRLVVNVSGSIELQP